MNHIGFNERISRLAASTVLFSFIFISVKIIFSFIVKAGTRIYITNGILIGFEHLVGPFFAASLFISFGYLCSYCFSEYFNFAGFDNELIISKYKSIAEEKYIKFIGATQAVMMICLLFSMISMLFLNLKLVLILFVILAGIIVTSTKNKKEKFGNVLKSYKNYYSNYKINLFKLTVTWVLGVLFIILLALTIYSSAHEKNLSVDFMQKVNDSIEFEFVNAAPEQVELVITNGNDKVIKQLNVSDFKHSLVELQGRNSDRNLYINLKKEEVVYYYDAYHEVFKGTINIFDYLKDGRNSIEINFEIEDGDVKREYKVQNTIDLLDGELSFAEEVMEIKL